MREPLLLLFGKDRQTPQTGTGEYSMYLEGAGRRGSSTAGFWKYTFLLWICCTEGALLVSPCTSSFSLEARSSVSLPKTTAAAWCIFSAKQKKKREKRFPHLFLFQPKLFRETGLN